MNILITNSVLKYRSGTETFIRDLALKLRVLGHEPMVYCTRAGKIADEIRRAGIAVVTDFHQLPHRPDIIHGHHHVQTLDALAHFEGVPGIFVCHDRLAKHDVPPLHPRIRAYIAVDHNCRERFSHAGIADDKVRIIYNSVDMDRFRPRPPLPVRPLRALVFSNYASTANYLKPVIAACGKMGIALDIIGSGYGTGTDHPEDILGQYDLVFGKARCAMEAMVVGAAVILCDHVGLGPMVTLDGMPELRPLNFGMRCLRFSVTEQGIIDQINRYDAPDASAVSAYMRAHATLSQMTAAYLDVYQDVLFLEIDQEARPADEVGVYLDALAGQVEKSRDALAFFNITRGSLIREAGERYWTRRLGKFRKSWKRLFRPVGGSVPQVVKEETAIDPDVTCHLELRGRLQGIDPSLDQIAQAERVILKRVIENGKKRK